ncbi:MAG: hypothetical protein U0359_38890 [Byssovorax sp.]
MYLDKLAGLKTTLLEATDLSEIFEHFVEELGSDPSFARSGEATKDEPLLKAAATAAAQSTGEAGAMVGNAFRIRSHRFVHGSFSYGKKWQLILLYFDDVKQGFLAIGDEEGPSRFTRFSVIATPDGKRPKVH